MSGAGKKLINADFEGADVKAAGIEEDAPRTTDKTRKSKTSVSSCPSFSAAGPSSNVPKSKAKLGQQSSSPRDIPNHWTSMHWGGTSEKGLWEDGSMHDEKFDDGSLTEEEEEMAPPHEWIAKKLARNQIFSSSMCEGNGRTLKGRDLSRVRNAIWTRTGFLE